MLVAGDGIVVRAGHVVVGIITPVPKSRHHKPPQPRTKKNRIQKINQPRQPVNTGKTAMYGARGGTRKPDQAAIAPAPVRPPEVPTCKANSTGESVKSVRKNVNTHLDQNLEKREIQKTATTNPHKQKQLTRSPPNTNARSERTKNRGLETRRAGSAWYLFINAHIDRL